VSISKFLKDLCSTLFAARTRTTLSSMGMLGLVVIPVAGMALLQTSQPEQQEAQTQQIGAPGGQAWAWGRNNIGQLGDGTTTDRNSPVQVSSLSGITTVAGGELHSLALKNDGTVWAWGHNRAGQLGDGTNTERNSPVQVANLSGVTAIAAGWQHSLAVTGTTAPKVTSTVPTGTTPVAPTTTVEATFSEPVQNVSPETFILERQIAVKKAAPKYVRVDATVSQSAEGISAVLTPVEDLPKGEYRATITTAVTDMATPANALEDPVVWTFTVAK
jgi:Bacterial Ig-like domain/Regulator of chromosome condensation (RCC1) repeat